MLEENLVNYILPTDYLKMRRRNKGEKKTKKEKKKGGKEGEFTQVEGASKISTKRACY